MQNHAPLTCSEFITHIENITLHVLVDLPGASSASGEPSQSFSPAYYQSMHSHILAELFVCREGEILIDTPDSMLVLHANDAALIPPGIPHYKVTDNTYLQYSAIRFSCKHHNQPGTTDLYKQFIPFFQGKEIIMYRNQPEIIRSVSQIISLAENRGSLLPAIRTVELLLALDKQQANSIQTENSPFLSDSDYNRISILEQWLSISFMQPCTQSEIAQKLHVSPRQLDRIARKHLGMSFHQAIMARRITAAEKMLLTTDMTAEKICFAVGFSSLSGFYREFNRKHGVTPDKFRKE